MTTTMGHHQQDSHWGPHDWEFDYGHGVVGWVPAQFMGADYDCIGFEPLPARIYQGVHTILE